MDEEDDEDGSFRSNSNRRRRKLRLNTNILSLIQEGQFEIVEKRLKRIRAGSKGKFAGILKKYQKRDVEMLMTPDTRFGRLPIHWACLLGPRLKKKTIKILLHVCPESAKKYDNEGSTPLHYLLHRGVFNNDVLKILLDTYPEAVMIRDRFGRTPMFHLVANNSIEKIKMSALAILLNTDKCVDTLRQPCGPLDTGSPTESYESQSLKTNNEIWEQPPAHRTPLYMMWQIALTHRSQRWWKRGKDVVPKLDGKKMLIALNFLGCAYLREVNGSVNFTFRSRRKMRRQMMKSMKTVISERKSATDIQAAGSDMEIEGTEHALEIVGGSDTENEWSLRLYSSNRIGFPEEEEFTVSKSARSFDSLETPLARDRSTRYPNGEESDEFSMPLSNAYVANIDSNSDSQNEEKTDASLPRKLKLKLTSIKQKQKRKERRLQREKNRSLDFIDGDFPHSSQRETLRFDRFRLKKELAPTKFRFTHAVCTFHQWLPKETIDIAKEHYPKHFEKREEITGDIPIHLAIKKGASKDLLKKLLDANKNSASIPTTLGKQLPLHLLFESGDCNLSKIQCLLDAYPDGIETIDQKSGLFAFALPEFHRKDINPVPLSSPRLNRPLVIPESHSLSESDVQRQVLQCETTTSVYKLLLKKPSILKEYCTTRT